MPAKLPRPYVTMLEEHRRRLGRVVERGGVKPMVQLYDRAISGLTHRLSKIAKPRTTYTAHQHRLAVAQLKQGRALLARRMRGQLGDISRTVQVEALRGLGDDLARLESSFAGMDIVLPIDEAARFEGVITGRRESLLRAHDESLARWTVDGVQAMEGELSMSLLMAEDFGQAVDRIGRVVDAERWQAERIARTELSMAFNATQADGIEECAEELPDLWMRWSEQVDDVTGEPLDSRVAEDSIMMHGQVVRPGDMFRMPNDMPGGAPIPPKVWARVKHLAGKAWPAPPNRPNDRSTITPVRPHWGITGWQLLMGQRVPWPG